MVLTRSDYILLFLALFFPPLVALLKCGWRSKELLISLLLTLLYIPGVIHAWYMISKGRRRSNKVGDLEKNTLQRKESEVFKAPVRVPSIVTVPEWQQNGEFTDLGLEEEKVRKMSYTSFVDKARAAGRHNSKGQIRLDTAKKLAELSSVPAALKRNTR